MASRHMHSLQEVLESREALEAFTAWAKQDPSRCADALTLHAAIKRFKLEFDKRPENARTLAMQTHRNYISLKTGTCDFLPDSLRTEMSGRTHALKTAGTTRGFFDPIAAPLEEHLRGLHAKFLCSEAFFALSRSSHVVDDQRPSTSGHGSTATLTRREGRSASLSAAPSPRVLFPAAPAPVTTLRAQWPPVLNNPFKTYKIDSVAVDGPEADAAAVARHHTCEERESFAGTLGDKLSRLADCMSKKGVEFARDLRSFEEDLTDEAVERDIDDYCSRVDEPVGDLKTSHSPPSIPEAAPSDSGYSAYGGRNGFAPPPTNKLRRKYMETTATTALGFPPSPSTKKGRSALYSESVSSGIYSGFSSGSSAFSSHFSSTAPHFNTLRRPSQHEFFSGPSFPVDAPAFPPPFFPASPVHCTIPSGFATLPRPVARARAPISSAPGSATGAPAPDGKIQLKVVIAGSRPMIFRTEAEEITLKKFRTIFGISKDGNKFFFKNACDEDEDEEVDYQWELISDDAAVVPVYRGGITAECRPIPDSPL